MFQAIEFITTTYRRLKNWVDGLGFVTKSLIILFLKSIVASLILSFLAPFATAYYAIYFGFRVPIEGVPFVTAAIATLSFLGFLATGVILGTIVILGVQIRLHSALARKYEAIARNLINSDETWRKRLGYALQAAPAGLIAIFMLAQTIYVFLRHSNNTETTAQNANIAVVLALMSVTFTVFGLSVVFATKIISFFKVQVLISSVVVFAMGISIFLPPVYGSFLRVIRYGGGLSMNVVVLRESLHEEIKGFMLIQNSDVVVLMSQDGSSILEVKERDIVTKKLSRNGEWRLPEGGVDQQRRYIEFSGS